MRSKWRVYRAPFLLQRYSKGLTPDQNGLGRLPIENGNLRRSERPVSGNCLMETLLTPSYRWCCFLFKKGLLRMSFISEFLPALALAIALSPLLLTRRLRRNSLSLTASPPCRAVRLTKCGCPVTADRSGAQ
jgi:hypothetical protein